MDSGYLIIHPPIANNDITLLEGLLDKAGVFVTSALAVTNPYDLREYLALTATGNSIRAVLDRNLTSRAIRLARGTAIEHDSPDAQTARVAAACMAFLISAEINIEPNISMYEAAQHAGAWAANDVLWFRRADNLDPQAFADFALQRTNQLSAAALENASIHVATEPDLQGELIKPLRHWRHHYYCLLKLALLKRDQRLAPHEKVQVLLTWSLDEGFFDASVIGLAMMYFGQHQRAHVLKHLNTNNADRCIAGLKNTAWDLTYVSHWVKWAQEQQVHGWLFCTNDHALARLAEELVRPANEECDAPLARLLVQHWPKHHRRLLRHYQECWIRACNSPEREETMKQRFQQVDQRTKILEEELRHTCR